MLNIPTASPNTETSDSKQVGFVRRGIGYVQPFSIKNQARYTAINYMMHRSYWENTMTNGLKWQGYAGFRWLGGGQTARGANITGEKLGGSVSSYMARRGGQIVTKLWGDQYGKAFTDRGLKGIVEMARKANGNRKMYDIIYKTAHNLAGGAETTIFATDDAAKVIDKTYSIFTDIPNKKTISYTVDGVAHSFDKVDGMIKTKIGSPLVMKTVSKGTMRALTTAGKVANIAGWIALVAGVGYKMGKFTVGIADKMLARLANKLETLNSPDVFTAPQLMNKYSMSIRERALQEIHTSNFSPRNMLLGREAEYLHQ
jgi:hypothetical protein